MSVTASYDYWISAYILLIVLHARFIFTNVGQTPVFNVEPIDYYLGQNKIAFKIDNTYGIICAKKYKKSIKLDISHKSADDKSTWHLNIAWNKSKFNNLDHISKPVIESGVIINQSCK